MEEEEEEAKAKPAASFVGEVGEMRLGGEVLLGPPIAEGGSEKVASMDGKVECFAAMSVEAAGVGGRVGRGMVMAEASRS